MKALTCAATAALAFGAFAPNALADGRNAGSVLFYPVHRSGTPVAPAGPWFTVICVSNTNTTPANPNSNGGSTNAHFEYVNVTPNPQAGVNPLAKFLPVGCTIFDRIEFLTPGDTLCVLTSCHNAFSPGGQEGYVVVSAEDPNFSPGHAWNHNWLIGSEMVLSASGVSYMVNAIPFSADGGTGPRNHTHSGGAPFTLDFDGTVNNYEAAPDILMSDFIGAMNSQLALINLTGGPTIENSLFITVWNDNEVALSSTLRFRCWFDCPLQDVSPLFSPAFLAGLGNDPDELDITCDGNGDLETGWFSIDSTGTWFSGGQNFNGDGAVIGSITAGHTSVRGGKLLWESGRQPNGQWRTP